ncbi:hypothetical protein BTO10_08230 [Vibrio chagasii]|uniref:Uncharacterized protein n=2 Tax=Vibrio chagasii TaxID=170679 RepID=A0A2S7VBJ7_9VIBR|nr:hypothetical protein BTO10_08230 [Vibrio chagasii]
MDAQGQFQAALESPYQANVEFTVQSKDGKSLYVVMANDDWENHELIGNTNCAIFKVDISDSGWSCLVEGHMALKPDSYWNEIKDGRFKPLQLDKEGNVYFLSRTFKIDEFKNPTYDFSTPGTIVKVNPNDGTVKHLTSDKAAINSFLVTQANSLIYRAEKLKFIPNLTAEKLSTIELEESLWHQGSYTVDDHNTVIYHDRDPINNKIQFAQPSDKYLGGIEKRSIEHRSPSNQLRQVLMGDDGFIYGIFNRAKSNDDGNWSEYAQLQRILPYASEEIVSFRTPSDNWWWQNQQMQVTKGHVYYIEEEKNHNFGVRDVIGVTRIADGKTVKLFGGDWSTERYDIESWKLVEGILYFTGLDNVTSEMVSGQLDTTKLNLNESTSKKNYLTVNRTASVHGEILSFQDMEVLRPARTEKLGGNPKIVDFIISDDDIYSGTIEFNKWMDPSSVGRELMVSETTGTEDIKVDKVDTMVVWLGRMAHLIYDTGNNPEKQNAPLKFGQSYRAFIGADARDSDGLSIRSAQPDDADRTTDWVVRNDSGMKLSKAEYNSAFSSNKLLKFFIGTLRAKAFDSATSLNHKVEFTTSVKNRFTLELLEPSAHPFWPNNAVQGFSYDSLNDDFGWYTRVEDASHRELDANVSYLGGGLMRVAVHLYEKDANIVFAVTLTDDTGKTQRFQNTMTKPNSASYSFEYKSTVSGFRGGIIDNFKVTEEPGSIAENILVDEVFDSALTISNGNTFTFSS